MTRTGVTLIFFRERPDECECDGEKIPLDVGSPQPPSSPDFIGSDASSYANTNQNPEILLSLCGGLKGNRVSEKALVLRLF